MPTAHPLLDPPVDDSTRRQFLGLLAATGLLAACSEEAPVSGDRSSPDSRTVSDVFGTVEVPSDPRRIVFADWVTLGNALALGLDPERVAGAGFGGEAEAQRVTWQGLADPTGFTDVGFFWEPKLERIAAADPDLIIMLGRDDEEFREYRATYSQLGVPVVAAPNQNTTLDDVEALLFVTADALGLREEAQALADRFRTDLMSAAAADGLPRVNVVTSGYDEIALTETLVLNELQLSDFRRPSKDDHRQLISPERLDLVDADLVIVASEDETVSASQAALESNPLWETLGAVRSGNVHWTDYPIFEYSYPALQGQLAVFQKALAGYNA